MHFARETQNFLKVKYACINMVKVLFARYCFAQMILLDPFWISVELMKYV